MIRLLLAASLAIPLGLDLYMPVPEDNPLKAEKIELGRRLFTDRRLSRDGSIACVSCHDPDRAFSDGRAIAVGVFGRAGRRNAPAIVNRGYGRAFFWDGRAQSLEEQVLKPIQDPNEMDLTLHEAATRMGVDVPTIARVLASYVRSILSGDSAYDRFINGDDGTLSVEQHAGMQIFRGKGNCTACHVGPNFTDERLHNTGVAWRDPSTLRPAQDRPEPSRATSSSGQVTGYYADEGGGNGTFKTPTLREVERTAPYMHDGSMTTLEEVIDFYDDGGRSNPSIDPEIHPLHLSVEEKLALVAFLKSLSGSIHEGQP